MRTLRHHVPGLTVDCARLPEAGIQQLARLVRWHLQAHPHALNQPRRVPMLVGLSGSVAAGKTTLAHSLCAALTDQGRLAVAVVGTDGFLQPDSELARRGVLHRKGFPDTYDDERLESFLGALREGAPRLSVPIYCHRSRAVTRSETLSTPDLLIIEGVVALRALERARLESTCRVYLQASLACIERWYVDRYRSVRREGTDARDTPALEARARAVWQETNLPNLLEHIQHGRASADLVVHKRADHSIAQIDVRAHAPVPGAVQAWSRSVVEAC